MDEELMISGLTIEFTEEYKDFPTFVSKTTDPIYRAIIDGFNDVRETGKMNLTVKANVDKTQFKTLFEYTKADAYILKDVINPYFEQKEDYEICEVIMQIYSELVKN